jgi:hypothetical protein
MPILHWPPEQLGKKSEVLISIYTPILAGLVALIIVISLLISYSIIVVMAVVMYRGHGRVQQGEVLGKASL